MIALFIFEIPGAREGEQAKTAGHWKATTRFKMAINSALYYTRSTKHSPGANTP